MKSESQRSGRGGAGVVAPLCSAFNGLSPAKVQDGDASLPTLEDKIRHWHSAHLVELCQVLFHCETFK